MVRRLMTSAFLMIVFATIVSHPAHAQGNGNGAEQEKGTGNGSSDHGASSNAGGVSAEVSNAPAKADEDVALEAVRTEDALPLQDILPKVRRSTTARVIDAQLFPVNGVLVYEVKVLAPDGMVSLYYYYAGSGEEFRLD